MKYPSLSHQKVVFGVTNGGECQQQIVDILSGKVYRVDVTPLFEPMSEMCALPEASWT